MNAQNVEEAGDMVNNVKNVIFLFLITLGYGRRSSTSSREECIQDSSRMVSTCLLRCYARLVFINVV